MDAEAMHELAILPSILEGNCAVQPLFNRNSLSESYFLFSQPTHGRPFIQQWP
jgi:hypothetical protein